MVPVKLKQHCYINYTEIKIKKKATFIHICTTAGQDKISEAATSTKRLPKDM